MSLTAQLSWLLLFCAAVLAVAAFGLALVLFLAWREHSKPPESR